MPFCGNCGQEHQGSNFCPNCGTPQNAVVGASEPPTKDHDETTVWEGSTKDMVNAASNGRLTSCRYRLTNKSVYFDEGLLTSNSQHVPLWAVRDVNAKQGLLQKARGLGDVIVRIEHPDYTGKKELLLRDIEGPLTVRDQLNRYATKERREHDRHEKTQWYGRGD